MSETRKPRLCLYPWGRGKALCGRPELPNALELELELLNRSAEVEHCPTCLDIIAAWHESGHEPDLPEFAEEYLAR